MKKLRIAAICILAVLAVFAFGACSSKKSPKMYTVTFNTMGGSAVSSYKLEAGKKITRPKTIPTKEMFVFDDWYWENPKKAGEIQKFVFGTKISQNITLFAGWIGETSVKIDFDPNGGAFENDKEVSLYGLIGAQMTEPEDVPTRTGYVFDGWYTEEECYNKFPFSVFPSDNATLYAGWARDTENYVFISYYGNDELLLVEPVEKDEDVVLPDLFDADSDIVTTGWFVDNNPNRPYTFGKATVDLDLYTDYYTNGLVFSSSTRYSTVAGYEGTATKVIVPPAYGGKPVTAIGDDAFYRTGELPSIKSVSLPDSITTIGDRAFYNCQYLASINLTDNVTHIGENAFYRNTRLRTVGDITGVMGEGLGAGAFNGCSDLRQIELGNGLTKISDYTFNDCSALNQITLSGALKGIGNYAFSGCTSLKSIEIESSVLETIGDYAFADCSALVDVTIAKESAAVTLGGNAFLNSRNVTIYVPSNLLDAYKNNATNNKFKDKFAAIR
ncbi:MAG: leucine-rich repeat protein [Clostridiales bacterium]|nr:leucine-rich repeat protein [Clostridiales bacterium]